MRPEHVLSQHILVSLIHQALYVETRMPVNPTQSGIDLHQLENAPSSKTDANHSVIFSSRELSEINFNIIKFIIKVYSLY